MFLTSSHRLNSLWVVATCVKDCFLKSLLVVKNNDHRYSYTYRYIDNNNGNNNNYHGLDVHDTSYIKGIKITDVDRSNTHLLKVILERTSDNNGNISKYISVVAVRKDDQTVAGSTTVRGDDINNSLTVEVVLKNKNNKNGNLDGSSDVEVWVLPATIST
jgi:secreted PhoX family phosphatase